MRGTALGHGVPDAGSGAQRPAATAGWPPALTGVLLGATLLLLLLTAANVGGPVVRGPLTLLVLGLVPGAALLVRWGPPEIATRLAIAVGLSVAVNILGSCTMAWTGLWFPQVYLILLTICCAPVLALDLATRFIADEPSGVTDTDDADPTARTQVLALPPLPAEPAVDEAVEPTAADLTTDLTTDLTVATARAVADETVELRLPFDGETPLLSAATLRRLHSGRFDPARPRDEDAG